MIDVLLTPADLTAAEPILADSQIVVLDVLRTTSTIITALNAGAHDLFLFDNPDAARATKSAAIHPAPLLLAGEINCLKPADFDLGNSPREHLTEKVGGSNHPPLHHQRHPRRSPRPLRQNPLRRQPPQRLRHR